jgi:hypothetical protein
MKREVKMFKKGKKLKEKIIFSLGIFILILLIIFIFQNYFSNVQLSPSNCIDKDNTDIRNNNDQSFFIPSSSVLGTQSYFDGKMSNSKIKEYYCYKNFFGVEKIGLAFRTCSNGVYNKDNSWACVNECDLTCQNNLLKNGVSGSDLNKIQLKNTRITNPVPKNTGVIAEDVNQDGKVDAVDVQLVINSALGLNPDSNSDVNLDTAINAVDVQLVINCALGLGNICKNYGLPTGSPVYIINNLNVKTKCKTVSSSSERTKFIFSVFDSKGIGTKGYNIRMITPSNAELQNICNNPSLCTDFSLYRGEIKEVIININDQTICCGKPSLALTQTFKIDDRNVPQDISVPKESISMTATCINSNGGCTFKAYKGNSGILWMAGNCVIET